MPYPNFHAARVRSPDDFIEGSYATIHLKLGLTLLSAKLKSDGMKGPMTAQAYRFDRKKFTAAQARDWLKKHKIKTILFEPASGKVEEVSMTTMIAPNFEKCWSKVVKKKKITEASIAATSSNLTNDEMRGSFEELRGKIKKALEDTSTYGKYPYVMATFKDHFFVSAEGPGMISKYYRMEYTLKGDDVILGAATELEKVTKYVMKEWKDDLFTEIKKIILEGGPGSGYRGHKGRPGHRGGSLPGGGVGKKNGAGIFRVVSIKGNVLKKELVKKGEGGGFKPGSEKAIIGSSKALKAMQKTADKYWRDKFGGQAGMTAAVSQKVKEKISGQPAGATVKPENVFRDGKLDMGGYKKLSDADKTSVLEYAASQGKEMYVPKAAQGDKAKDPIWATQNKKIGELEGIARSYEKKIAGLTRGSKEHRGAMHVIVAMKEKVLAMSKSNIAKAPAEVKVGTAKAGAAVLQQTVVAGQGNK